MAVKAALFDPKDGTTIEVERFWKGPHKLNKDARSLLVTEHYKSHGVFKTLTFSGSGTTTLILPNANGSLILTDLILTGDKVNAGAIEVLFTDGVIEDTIIKPV
ncbi:hypothetical protein KAT92_05845, partial [Candidatus Babeliales bacterium]|nr:hypothetical protein [Candidatus Babeliales bacterium]